jgi:hypothetical protein
MTMRTISDEEFISMLEQDASMRVRAYSGRMMFGKQCASVIVEDIFAALADIAVCCQDVDVVSDILRTAKTDSMGRDSVIYWPYVKFADQDANS